MKKYVKMTILLLVLVISATNLMAQGVVEKPVVKVLVLDMFEVGANKGDFAGEFQNYYETYFDGAESYTLNSMPLTLYINDDGVAGCIAGMGKAQASSTLTAILSDPRFDFSQTYILVSGCSGMPPQRGTLGDVVWANELVDFELGHAWTESDIAPGTSATFLRSEGYDRAGYIKLNASLSQWAYETTKDVVLVDDPKAAAYRANYGAAEALETPAVRMGVSVTGDSYWHGEHSSLHADEVCAAYGAGTYMVTQMEDSAFGVAAMNYGLLDRLLVCRDVVNFDQPYPGQTVLESLSASSGAFSMGMKNGFLVGSKVIDSLVANWDSYGTTIPSVK
ncbi:purine nucleoside permease [Sphaerochaeta pleomorpha str. Grapes]|uniref:Purine nucleoside permease n=1 Tax=Sphaerochaeta pleomorpha (strain ATCC BAA-1885 / DSM 22778 / Grapes) TaxID=158190 RepID=G8QUI6_SPHPG|nr:purine nucleoside permease [Sphaerochaeta pleomorpha]AEV29219.1 purine nucleoside permease [Sphaerochaeta pleomorpha str. Grapes]